MMRKNIIRGELLLAAAGTLAVLCACPGLELPVLDGRCRYVEIEGTMKVLEVRPAAPGGYSCPADPVEVWFEFTPMDPEGRSRYRYPEEMDTRVALKVGSGMDPSRAWAEEQGLSPGSVHRAARREVIAGACAPVVFGFPDLDLARSDRLCFPD